MRKLGKSKYVFLSAMLLFTGLFGYASPGGGKVIDGYPIANFALTVNASEDGGFFGRILRNPGELGEWLLDRGTVTFGVAKNGKRHLFSEFGDKQIQRAFPSVEGVYGKSPLIAAQIRTQAFCPLGINDLDVSSLPVLLLDINCSSTGKGEDFAIEVRPDSLAKNVQAFTESSYSGIGNAEFQLSADVPATWGNGALSIPVSLKAGETKRVRVLMSFYDKDWVAAKNFRNVGEITRYAYRAWESLKANTELFAKAIPNTGDKELDTYLRWYMVPGISLTKCTSNDEVLTMGYSELNQRDSYWTSWLHLVLFKGLEKKMLEESIAYQQPSGKIPTTILPLIEREDDLDINAFFILRVVRYYQLYHNEKELSAYWPALAKAMDWLISRDSNGNGLPVQVSFWGDWKDVGGIEGRMYSPFSGLIYLAALKQLIPLAEELGQTEAAGKYKDAYQKGYAFINKPVEEGGLWNGNYYCQRWRNGEVNDKLLQDQAIGILFDVVPRERALSIIASLNKKSMTPYGICETYPYYPAEFGYAPATYHNGAVWPWLSFMDCWARIHMGKKEEAIELVKKVANADLVASGDWSPNEHINSLTGKNLGYQLQGWNAGLFGLVYFGLLHTGIIP
jgi:glycogen debranching enzyme